MAGRDRRPRRGVPRRAGDPRRARRVAASVLVLLVGTATIAGLWWRSGASPAAEPAAPRAVLLDQLALYEPDPTFHEAVGRTLAAAGYELLVVPPEAVGVTAYRDLPAFGADLILLRTHAALIARGPVRTDEVALFSSDLVDLERYGVTGLGGPEDEAPAPGAAASAAADDIPPEMVADLVPVRRFVGADRRPYVGIGADFVREHMRGRLASGSVVVLMGCDTMRGRGISEAFLARGAGAVVGWSDEVSAGHTDAATALLVAHLAARVPVAEAIEAVTKQLGADPESGAYLVAAVQ